jgi:hypothetical protein
MLYKFMEDLTEDLAKAFRDVENSTQAAINGEKGYRDNLVEREKMMAEADGEEMSEEDLDQVVAVQVQTSPFKSKVDEDLQRVKKVMSNG